MKSKMEIMVTERFKRIKSHCNKCLQETNHFVIAMREHSDSESIDPHGPYSIDWSTTFTMLECCGCENVTLKRRFYFSEWDDDEIKYFPPQVSRQLPRWHDELPKEWVELIKEVYTALHADSRRLVLMGARALVDLYMNHQLGDTGGFQQKIKQLASEDLISKPNKECLEAALDAGHAATHRGYNPRVYEVNQVIDIVENLLQNYVLKSAAENLKEKTPARSEKSPG
ncbi:MAG: hypothetical protein COA36_03645 [Desulfotalea sp.]|nr:MAG: hypothetical protein COA36_03645 [Desulfotalea sp.]